MKVQCDLCREIVPLADFIPSEAGLSIVCPACHGTYFVAAPARDGVQPPPAPAGPPATAVAAAAAVDGMNCPKCGRRQPAAAACRHCGLVIALWDPAEAAATAGDDDARRLFAAAEASWPDVARHEAFIEHCARVGQLPFAARCYRERLARDPIDAVARVQQARVVTVAEITCLLSPREAADAPLPHRRVLIGAVIALFGVLLAVLTVPLWRWWH